MCGQTTAKAPEGIPLHRVESTMDLYEAMMSMAPDYDVIIQAAAPADYRFAVSHQQKLKKEGGMPLVLELVENPDIAAAIGAQRKPNQTLVGFAAETQNLDINARKKLEKKNLDMIVANDVSQAGAGFNVDTNIATLITHKGSKECSLRTKKELAQDILDEILLLRS